MSTALLDAVVKKNRARLIPFMLALYVLAFLDRSNIGFAKQTYQIDTGLSNEAYALGAGIFFVVYAFLGVPANLLMRKLGARTWIGTTTLLWGFLSAAMAWADTEAKFLIVRTLLGAAEAGFFPGMIYLTSQWFPQRNRASIMGLFYMGAPLALTLGSPLSGALLEMHGFMGHPGWFWMFVIEGLLAVGAGVFTFFWLDDTPEQARFLSKQEKTLLINQLASEEQQKVTSRLSDALRNGTSLATGDYLPDHSGSGLRINFLPADPGCCIAGDKSGLYGVGGHRHSVGCGLVWNLAYSALLR